MFKSPLPLLGVVATAVFSFSACAGPQSEFLVDPGAVGPYSSGVIVGDMVMLSGKIGAERDGTFEREVETCIDAIAAELAGLDLGLGDVVEARVYLIDMARYGDFNAIYGARFSKPYPARTCVAVKELPVGARVEIQVVARR